MKQKIFISLVILIIGGLIGWYISDTLPTKMLKSDAVAVTTSDSEMSQLRGALQGLEDSVTNLKTQTNERLVSQMALFQSYIDSAQKEITAKTTELSKVNNDLTQYTQRTNNLTNLINKNKIDLSNLQHQGAPATKITAKKTELTQNQEKLNTNNILLKNTSSTKSTLEASLSLSQGILNTATSSLADTAKTAEDLSKIFGDDIAQRIKDMNDKMDEIEKGMQGGGTDGTGGDEEEGGGDKEECRAVIEDSPTNPFTVGINESFMTGTSAPTCSSGLRSYVENIGVTKGGCVSVKINLKNLDQAAAEAFGNNKLLDCFDDASLEADTDGYLKFKFGKKF